MAAVVSTAAIDPRWPTLEREARDRFGVAALRLPQRLHLVLHERDERRDDDAGARPDKRGDLVAQRLAAAGRHQDQRVAAPDDVLDDLLLLPAERLVAEHAVQDRLRALCPVVDARTTRVGAAQASTAWPAAIQGIGVWEERGERA